MGSVIQKHVTLPVKHALVICNGDAFSGANLTNIQVHAT